MRTSPIWQLTKNELQIFLDSSDSISKILKYLKLNIASGNHRTLNKRIELEQLSLIQLNLNRENNKYKLLNRIRKITSNEKMFVIGSRFTSSELKRRILKNESIPYECNFCKNKGTWRNDKLSLQLDHINGINNDNRLINLRFLCPNCHSQTETYSGKSIRPNSKKVNTVCVDCGTKIRKKSKRCKCCLGKFRRKKINTIEINDKLKELGNYSAVGRYYSVSANTIKKWINRN